MSIYRTSDGKEILRRWCAAKVEAGPWDETRSVETSLGTTHVASVGRGERSVLWLPGTNFNAATSAPLAELVDDRCRLSVVDLPGQPGLSAPVELGRDRLTRYGRWLNEVVVELGGEAVIVAGHSLGAAVALSAEPTPMFEALVLLGPAGITRVRITPRLLAVTTRWVARPSAANASSLIRYMQHASSAVDPDLVEWLTLVAEHTRQHGAPGPVSREHLARWRGRATVVTGAADRFFPPERLRPATTAGLDAAVEVVADAGHLLPSEQAEHVLQLLLDID